MTFGNGKHPSRLLLSVEALFALCTVWMPLFGFVTSLKTGNGTVCQTGWFGSVCQFKCQCVNNQCDENGQCTGDATCQLGWFGPTCQYVDLAAGQGTWPVLTDGDEKTCLHNTTARQLHIPVNHQFTWLRVHVREPGVLRNLSFSLRRQLNSTICQKRSRVIIDQRTLDFHCEIPGIVEDVAIKGTAVTFLCSVYISGGRNLALKQNVTQSSTFYENNRDTRHRAIYFTADRAVDGNTDGNFYVGLSCSHTQADYPTPGFLVLILSPPAIVTRYVIYNRAGGHGHRARGVSIQSYDVRGSEVFCFRDPDTVTKAIYTASHDPMVVATVKVTTNHSLNILAICELEVYGEMLCDVGKYGLECEKNCNCFIQENCLPVDGFCPSECADGYTGTDCGTTCSPGKYGRHCQDSCSQHCLTDSTNNTSCDHETGYCHHGCEIGYQKPKCELHCPQNKFGPQCHSYCSPACKSPSNTTVDSLCDQLNGTCLYGCDIGYWTSTCSISCEPNKYGINCEQTCSRGCLEAPESSLSSCDHINGSCTLGCRSGYNGTWCTRGEFKLLRNDAKSKPRAWIILAVAVGVLWAVAIVFIIFCIQKKSRSADEEDTE